MALFAVIHKTRFQRRLYARDNGFVNIAFALFAAFDLNLVIQQLLPVDNRQAAFFGLGGIDQHAFHRFFLLSQQTNRPTAGRTAVNPLAEHENEEELPESLRTKRDGGRSSWPRAQARPGIGAWRWVINTVCACITALVVTWIRVELALTTRPASRWGYSVSGSRFQTSGSAPKVCPGAANALKRATRWRWQLWLGALLVTTALNLTAYPTSTTSAQPV